MNRIFFTADLHFGHRNILRHESNRPFAAEGLIKEHDEWLLNLWKSTADKKDDIYILGDLTFYKNDDARKLLEKLPGRKHLITGNHDGSVKTYSSYFASIVPLRTIVIKPTRCPFLERDLRLVLCHYPLITWNYKPYGSLMLHGHCHGKLDEYNSKSPDLRFDVGIDGSLSRQLGERSIDYDHALISIEDIYEAAVQKAGSNDFLSYAMQNYRQEVR